MKKVLYLSIAIVAMIIAWQFYPSDSSVAYRSGPEHAENYPDEWMYLQRAYPNGINEKAIENAWKQRRTELLSKSTKNLGTWEQVGPLNIGGRITDIAISPDDDNTFYIGCAVGGVFKTTDRGQNWSPIFDEAGRPSIGSIAIAPSNADRVYVGTGEANGSGTSGAFFGDGVWRSDDAGSTWVQSGLPDSHHIGRLVVDPDDPDRVFAATTGILYGTSSTRGLYRTLDGGENWEQVLFISDSTACIDVVMHPTDTDTLLASTWERRRRPWGRTYGGETSRIYRSVDGGDSWQQLSNGLPEDDPQTGRIGLAISATEPDVIYASYTTDAITNEFAGLYRSEDSGDNWELVALGDISDVNSTFGWYFGNVRVNPHDESDVYVLGQTLYRSTNAAASWSADAQMHVDHHAMEWSTQDPDMVLSGNDGGLYISENNGVTWSHFENLPITQFYQIEVDESDPDQVYGGAQDNFTLRTLTGELTDYEPILGGDGFHVNVDPEDNSLVYAEYQWGNLFRSTSNGNFMEYAISDIASADRTNWNTPVIMSPYDPSILYYGANRLWRSEDNGISWFVISPDLTQGEHPSGASGYGTLTTLAASALNDEVVYTGSDDGKVQVTFDAGDTWEDISADLPQRYVTGLAIDPSDDQIAYVTYSGYRMTDYTPHVYKTVNGGDTWIDVSGDLPSIPVNDILITTDPYRLFIATDMGVYYSEDDGVQWNILGSNLPPTIMSHLQWHAPSDQLFIGSFGRSIYRFDLGQLTATGIHELEDYDEQIRLYPNPTAEWLNVERPVDSQVEYRIYDVLGNLVLQGILGRTEVQVDVSSLSSGAYTIHVYDTVDILTARFQKND